MIHPKYPGRIFGILAAATLLPLSTTAADGVKMTKLDDRVRVEINGELFTEFIFKGAPHVYYYPLLAPGGVKMTRDWPMKEAEGEEHDHPHHRSLWFSHSSVNGLDFWTEGPRGGKIIHDKLVEVQSGPKVGWIKHTSKWIGKEDKVYLTDETTFRVYNAPGARVFGFEVTLKAPDGEDVLMGDNKDALMAIRLAETMRLKSNKMNAGKPAGNIVMSTGVKDKDTWGKRAEWVDYYGPVGDKIMGVAMFDHPTNPRHPTWWHVRDYGLFSANPFGIHDFEGKKSEPHLGDMTIAGGKSITFRYGFYIHEGDTEKAKVAERYQEFLRSGGTKPKAE